MLQITEGVARCAQRWTLWLLELDGLVVGSGGLESFEDSAVLIAGCVHPEARRQGLHSAFMRFRLERAAQAGLAYALVASTPGDPTERSALRSGFSGAYTQTLIQQG
jgi:N-acetylglutamate synthase-like GNAT family acetyltransferase